MASERILSKEEIETLKGLRNQNIKRKRAKANKFARESFQIVLKSRPRDDFTKIEYVFHTY